MLDWGVGVHPAPLPAFRGAIATIGVIMPEIEDEVTLIIPVSSFYFSTKCEGDKIVISGLSLTAEEAASLTWLVNSCPHSSPTQLEVQIKQVEE